MFPPLPDEGIERRVELPSLKNLKVTCKIHSKRRDMDYRRNKYISETFTPLPLHKVRSRIMDGPNIDDDNKLPEPNESRPCLPKYIYDPTNERRQYKLGQFLGKGGFAWVFEVIDQINGERLACKIIPKDRFTKPHHREKVIREIEIHKTTCDHENVLKMYSSFEDTNNMYIMLELCQMRSLVNVLNNRGTVTEPECRVYIERLCNALHHLHQRGVLHRDVKLGNLLLNEAMQLKLCDFGLAILEDERRNSPVSVCGTPNYISPEVLEKRGHTYASEMWAVGCTMYALLDGKPPFETTTLDETYNLIRKCSYRMPANISESAQNLIRMLLHPVPERRPSPYEALQHAFLSRHYVPVYLAPGLASRPPRNGDITYPTTNALDITIPYTLEYVRPGYQPFQGHNSPWSRFTYADSRPSNNFTLLTPPVTTPTPYVYSQPFILHHSPSSPMLESGLSTSPFPTSPHDQNQYQQQQQQQHHINYRPRSTSIVNAGISLCPLSQQSNYQTSPYFSMQIPQVPSQQLVCASLSPPLAPLARAEHWSPPLSSPPSPPIDFISGSASGDSGLGSEKTKHQHEQIHPLFTPNAASSPKCLSHSGSSEYFSIYHANPQLDVILDMLRRLKSNDPLLKVSSCKRNGFVEDNESLLVSKWVDYTNQFGFGCMFSDGSCSVYYDDLTKMTLSAGGSAMQYVVGGSGTCHPCNQAPNHLQDKLKVCNFFKDFMAEKLDNCCRARSPPSNRLPYLVDTLRCERGILFHLSTGHMQVNLCGSHCKVNLRVVNTEMRNHRLAMRVTFMDKSRNEHYFTLILLHHNTQDPFLGDASNLVRPMRDSLCRSYDVIREYKPRPLVTDI